MEEARIAGMLWEVLEDVGLILDQVAQLTLVSPLSCSMSDKYQLVCLELALMRDPGTGGTANGGNVYSSQQGGLVNLDMLNVDSGNAGSGGQANSGPAIGGSGC